MEDIDSYHYNIDKVAFIELNLRQIKGYVATELDTKNYRIIVKNWSYHRMMYTVRRFNVKFKNTYIKLYPTKYFSIDGFCVSSKEFKILNVSKNIMKDNIEKAIFKIIKECSFHIKQSGIKLHFTNKNTNTIFFIVNNKIS